MSSVALAALGFIKSWWDSRQESRVAETQARALRIQHGIPGWADEFLIAVWSYPFIAQFMPGLRESAAQGLTAAAALPEWYIAGFMSISFAVFGINKLFQWKKI
ncbi:hypothetical protein [Microbulbifer sp. PSTR4-B]|uniref:hypothetical protein n=1 Tax=Microbulbifer sp. PSTR4-B TaxID=3243396 RepID=UPI00403A383C